MMLARGVSSAGLAAVLVTMPADVPSPGESEWHTYPAGSLGAITIERVCAFPGRDA